MTTQMIICFAISAVVIAGYIWNKLSVGTVGCIGIVLFLLTGCIGPKDILGNIGNANLVMITSMFVISEGFKRTKAIHLVASTVKKNLEGQHGHGHAGLYTGDCYGGYLYRQCGCSVLHCGSYRYRDL